MIVSYTWAQDALRLSEGWGRGVVMGIMRDLADMHGVSEVMKVDHKVYNWYASK